MLKRGCDVPGHERDVLRHNGDLLRPAADRAVYLLQLDEQVRHAMRDANRIRMQKAGEVGVRRAKDFLE